MNYILLLISYSKVTNKLCLQNGNVIHFTVMDHDLMWSNDFEGEAFLDISTIPGVCGELSDGCNDLKHAELFLIHPKGNPDMANDKLFMYSQQMNDMFLFRLSK